MSDIVIVCAICIQILLQVPGQILKTNNQLCYCKVNLFNYYI